MGCDGLGIVITRGREFFHPRHFSFFPRPGIILLPAAAKGRVYVCDEYCPTTPAAALRGCGYLDGTAQTMVRFFGGVFGGMNRD